MQFTTEYIDRVATAGADPKAGRMEDFTIDLPGFGVPPVLETARVLTEIGHVGFMNVSHETKALVLRHAIKGRLVKVLFRGKELGAFQMNNLDDNLDNFPVLSGNPAVVVLMMNLAMAHLLEKSMPPRQSDPAPAAGPVSPGL